MGKLGHQGSRLSSFENLCGCWGGHQDGPSSPQSPQTPCHPHLTPISPPEGLRQQWGGSCSLSDTQSESCGEFWMKFNHHPHEPPAWQLTACQLSYSFLGHLRWGQLARRLAFPSFDHTERQPMPRSPTSPHLIPPPSTPPHTPPTPDPRRPTHHPRRRPPTPDP